MLRRGTLFLCLLLLLLLVGAALGEQAALQQSVHLPVDVGTGVDATYMASTTQTSAPDGAASGPAAGGDSPTPAAFVPFDIDSYSRSDYRTALRDFARWQNQTIQDPNACKDAKALVWIASAGWGDSVNALTSSYRYAVGTGRLFFIQWSSANDPQLWRVGLREPGWVWDWADVLQRFPHCGFKEEDAYAVRSSRLSADGSLPRVASITGTIVADHPLAGALGKYANDFQHVMSALWDGRLQDALLQPNPTLQQWLTPIRKALKGKRKKNFGGVVGMQIRTGYADAAEKEHRPRNANFLADGDEQLFLDKFRTVWRVRYDADPSRTRVFLMTDSPAMRDTVTAELQKLGVQVVTATQGEVSHCGPSRDTSAEGVLRMLAEWFAFKRYTDVQIITAWSLFGSSAVEGKPEDSIYRIDASDCGKAGAKPCQMAYA